MKTNNKLNCYLFSNLIISFLSLNFLVNDNSTKLLAIQNNNTLNKIYEKEIKVENKVENVINNDITTITITKKDVQSKKEIPYVKPSYNSVTGANLANYAKNYLGLPYVSGGYSLTTGTDCSGFTKLIFQEFGINIGRTVSSQVYSGTYVSKADLQPGDLVFYGYSNYATHVGIYIGNGLVIHESNPKDGVKINSVNMMVYITARRLITADVSSSVHIEEKEENKEVEKDEIILEEALDKSENGILNDEIQLENEKKEENTNQKNEEIKDENINQKDEEIKEVEPETKEDSLPSNNTLTKDSNDEINGIIDDNLNETNQENDNKQSEVDINTDNNSN